ncbi:MAG: hypothetical protein IKN42_03105 [Elusimicrobia bacterium]|nr:hypothetical protein [Elusimicrobiota bacterium]
MSTENKKNTKWIVIGCIVFIIAILVAVGPILVTKYMRAKWQNAPKYKTNNLLMNVIGTLQKTEDDKIYLKGDGEKPFYYVLNNVDNEIYNKVGQHCSVLGKMKIPKDKNETIDGKPIRLFLFVQKIKFDDSTEISGIDRDVKPRDSEEIAKQKSLARTKLRIAVNAKLNKPILFDVIKGKVSIQNRKTLNGEDVSVAILTDDFGDNYMLYKKGITFPGLQDREVVCLGRDILPLKNMPIILDEITFEIYEIYDLEFKRLV